MRLPPVIAAAIDAGDTVISSSARGARALRRLHGEAQRDAGLEAWQSADVVHWDGWMDRQWQTLLRSGRESRLLLNGLQEQQVWARLVEPAVLGQRLISVHSVSQLAQSAFALLGNYRALHFLNGDLHFGADVENFRLWARAFETECRNEGWLSRSLLPHALAEGADALRLPAGGRLLLVGFDRFTPAQERLLEACREKGQRIETADDLNDLSQPQDLVEAGDRNEEIATCALWVRQQLDTLGDAVRIAVIVPGVATMRSHIQRTFRQILAPETTPVSTLEVPPPFEFSLGVPLAQLPMVRAAILLLGWMEGGLSQDEVSWLLLSGLVCHDEAEQLMIARFDARHRQQPMLPPAQDLESYLLSLDRNWSEAAALGALRRRLSRAQRAVPRSSELNFADWVVRAGQALDAAGWPGAYPLAGEDFQMKARWSQLLDQLAALAFDGRTVTYATFIAVLQQQAAETIYAPESRDAPVQILGPFEAAGLGFDALWFLGAEDASWPPAARPHPFLPRSLQRRYQMPHAHSEVDWRLAQQATTRLLNSAPQCRFSYAMVNAEGTCRPSVLVAADVVRTSAEAFRRQMGHGEDIASRHDFPATLRDAEPATVVPWPVDKEAGGADTLRNQAACPFRAFATRRLAARSRMEGDWDLDPRARGSLVHSVLEKVWAELANRDGLVEAIRNGDLKALVSQCLDEALEQYREEGPRQEWNTAYLAAQHARNLSIVEEWLTYEATRADFTVEVREDQRNATVGDLKLKLRVDRVDKVAEGRVIIDYKTGMVKADVWDGPRPDDPQLPIYAAFGEVEEVRGVLLGRIAEGKPDFIGRIGNQNSMFPKSTALSKPPYTETMLQEWKDQLLLLAQQFLRGEAQVDPKRYPKTCQYCELPGLCRVAESEQVTSEGDVDEGDGEAEG